MQSEMSAVLLSRGSIWNPNPWEPPYLLPDAGTVWPDSAATATFTDSSGATLVEIDGDVTPDGIRFLADPDDMDQVPAGANFTIELDTDDGPVMIRHGKVIRKENFYTQAPATTVKPALQFADSFQRRALGRKWVTIAGRPVIHNNGGLSLPNGVSPDSAFFSSAAMRYYVPFNTDTVRINVSVVNPLNAEAGKTSFVFCADINFTSGLAVQLETGPSFNEIHFGIVQSPSGVIYQGDPISNATHNGDNYTISYNDSTKTIAVYKGTGLTPLGTWTDDAAIVPHGPGYQHAGFIWNASLLTAGIQVTSWSGRDDS